MAQYEHLRLARLPERLERRKRISTPEAIAGRHGGFSVQLTE